MAQMISEVIDLGVKRILPYFVLFALIGFVVNKAVPAQVIIGLFSGENWYSVPLAAAIGLPLYVTGASTVPLLQVLVNAGASHGSVLAFLITGPATSAGVIAGIATIMKRRAILLYTSMILIGAVVSGYVYDVILRVAGVGH